MPEEADLPEANDPITLTSEIVAAYVSRNVLIPADLTKLITEVHAALVALKAGAVEQPVKERKPAVPIRKSVTPDYIICLEDGLKFKFLKRHLMTHHGMTPQQYRDKWSLPKDYPVVAPNYSAIRSRLAKNSGLGLRHKPAPESIPRPRSRRAKANA
jgi:predicted transcriptional regulator